jgi:hypothetical protein
VLVLINVFVVFIAEFEGFVVVDPATMRLAVDVVGLYCLLLHEGFEFFFFLLLNQWLYIIII